MIRSLCILGALVTTYALLAAPAPDPFRSGWGKPVDPDKDCKIRREKGALIIEMPGTVHEYNLHRKLLNAPRLLRDIEGDFEMQVRVRIDCRRSAKSSAKHLPSYVSAAFLIIPPEKHGMAFYRSGYRLDGQGDGADGSVEDIEQGAEGGGLTGIGPLKQHPRWPLKGKPDQVYLRLDRRGELLGIGISPDREKWLTIGGGLKIGLPSRLKVGLLACTRSTDRSKVIFDQLTISRDKRRKPWEFVSWGDLIDPDKDCKLQRDKDALTIELPGSDHDYDPVRARFNAPRSVSDLEGEFDLQARVQIGYHPSAQSTVKDKPSFVSAGFLLSYPEKHHLICSRLEYAVAQPGSRLAAPRIEPGMVVSARKSPPQKDKETDNYAVLKNWSPAYQRKGKRAALGQEGPRLLHNTMWERGWSKWPLPPKADYAYLRLEHRSSGWSNFYISPDGEKWTLLDYIPSIPEKGELALAAYSTSPHPSKVRFDQLKLWRPKKKEQP